MAQKSRAFVITWNNYDEDSINRIKGLNPRYMIVGKEIAPTTGTPHLQGYIYFENAKSINVVRKKLSGANVDVAKGSAEQNKVYCSKEGDYVEEGEIPKQGKRVDLDRIKDEVMNGKKVDDIAVENPDTFHKYGRTLSKLEDIAFRKKYREWMTMGYWYWGPTGVGKSHKAYEGFTPDTHYVWKLNDNNWQDGYTGQKIVIINDFRGEIKYNELLNLLDKWPHWIPRRGREPAPFLAEKVIITSSLRPSDIYNRRHEEDSLEQLQRRLIIERVEYIDTEVLRGNNSTAVLL